MLSTLSLTCIGMISGAVAGLVCITPAAGYVDMTGAFFIGFFGGPLCYFGAQLKHMMGYDDALDAFGVHAIGGIVGGIATGFFASPSVIANGGNINVEGVTRGVYYGSLDVGGLQLAHQLCGVLFAIGWAFVGKYVFIHSHIHPRSHRSHRSHNSFHTLLIPLLTTLSPFLLSSHAPSTTFTTFTLIPYTLSDNLPPSLSHFHIP